MKVGVWMSAAAVMVLGWGAVRHARADWTVTTGDFKEQRGLKINTWDLSDGLSVTLESGKLAVIPTRDVLAIGSSTTEGTPGAGSGWRLSLRNGDVLYGSPDAIKGQSLEFTTPELGAIDVPLKVVAALDAIKAGAAGGAGGVSAAGVPAPGQPADKDAVRFANDDRMEGLIIDVNAEKLKLAVAGPDHAVSDIDMKLVSRLTFAGVTLPRKIPALSARIEFVSGSVLTVPLDARQHSFSWTLNEITLKDPAGKERKTTGDAIAAIDVTGGRVVYLSDLDPAADEQSTFMGTHWPTQINQNAAGGPLKVGGVTYSRGLGVHTRSHLAFALDGSFDTLKLRVAMDDSAAPEGTADVSVLLDGKVIWESKGLPSRGEHQLLAELSLPIKGGKMLELRADPVLGNGKIDVLGRVDWLNPALTRS